MVPARGFFDAPAPLAFAHRGGAAEAPENTWQAFAYAVSLGYRYVETDIRATQDGVAVALHDPTIDRVSGQPGAVAKMTWRQLQAVRLHDGREVPRLDEMLATWPDLRWNIDVKKREAIAPVVDAIRHAGAADRVLVAAFSAHRTARVRAALGPQLATGAGRTAIARLVAAKTVPWLPIGTRPSAAQVPMRRHGLLILDAGFISACHRAGVAVHVWTVDDRDEMDRVLDLGVDGVMTDRPSLLKEVLVARGQWA
ncbi:MAG: glycerophosphodiester phosphodiesterase [Acidimicrobiales bacterium]